jgi:hypothetical protein
LWLSKFNLSGLNSPLLAAHPCERESAENTPPQAAGKFNFVAIDNGF